jgi:hypothetical protein
MTIFKNKKHSIMEPQVGAAASAIAAADFSFWSLFFKSGYYCKICNY